MWYETLKELIEKQRGLRDKLPPSWYEDLNITFSKPFFDPVEGQFPGYAITGEGKIVFSHNDKDCLASVEMKHWQKEELPKNTDPAKLPYWAVIVTIHNDTRITYRN
jgi:hypothetical protein